MGKLHFYYISVFMRQACGKSQQNGQFHDGSGRFRRRFQDGSMWENYIFATFARECAQVRANARPKHGKQDGSATVPYSSMP